MKGGGGIIRAMKTGIPCVDDTLDTDRHPTWVLLSVLAAIVIGLVIELVC